MEDDFDNRYKITCPFCKKKVTNFKISGIMNFFTCYCNNCGLQLSIRGRIAKAIFLNEYVRKIK